MDFAFIVISLLTILYLVYLYFTRTFNYWSSQNVAGPAPVPLFGNITDSVLRRVPIMIIMKKIYEAFPDEKIVGVFRMTMPNLLIRDPDIVKHVMIKDFDTFADRGVEISKDVLGGNLFHAEEETWRILRNKFTPLFTSGKIKNMLYLVSDRSDNFIKYVENVTATQPEQEVFQLLQKYTITSIAACAFGLDIDATEESDMMDSLLKIGKIMFTVNYGFELDMMYPGILASKLGSSILPSEVTIFFCNLIKQIIAARNGMVTNRKDFMDLILKMKHAKQVHVTKVKENVETKALEITDGLMAGQAFSFFGAGYDTSASTMGYMLMLLALNPDVQDKVVAEIKNVLEQHDDKITYEALNDMVYLGRVFDETLRMFPIVDTLQRKASKDYKIPGTDVTLKKGQIALISLCGLHYDEKYWPNPDKFDPDRFSPENSAGRHSAVYLPFGLGPRNCIGIRFAQVQSRVCMVKLLQRFRLQATEHTRRRFQYDPHRIVLTPFGGFKVDFLPRE